MPKSWWTILFVFQLLRGSSAIIYDFSRTIRNKLDLSICSKAKEYWAVRSLVQLSCFRKGKVLGVDATHIRISIIHLGILDQSVARGAKEVVNVRRSATVSTETVEETIRLTPAVSRSSRFPVLSFQFKERIDYSIETIVQSIH